jgi:hypothetical protein
MKWDALKFFNPFAEIERTANKLPHWQQPGATYFITFRLSDSIPAELRNRWQAERDQWLLHNPKPWSAEVATSINKHLHREGPLWQEDYFDRLIRDEEHFTNCARYIRRNPQKAGLKEDEFTLFESDFAKRR